MAVRAARAPIEPGRWPQVAQLAEQLQNQAADWLHDAGRPPEWPNCLQHPGAPHRLNPEVRDDGAVRAFCKAAR
ncbi:MAG TPA: hypothetical protein VMI33_00610 [Streptosporangiaceae bacterium]|nr:hypothetical protein [Streptosporangiaceae bacterium]